MPAIETEGTSEISFSSYIPMCPGSRRVSTPEGTVISPSRSRFVVISVDSSTRDACPQQLELIGAQDALREDQTEPLAYDHHQHLVVFDRTLDGLPPPPERTGGADRAELLFAELDGNLREARA